MKVLIVGGGKVGKNLTHFLIEQDGHSVTLIDRSEKVVQQLITEMPDGVVVEGDGCDPVVLRDAGIEQVDAVVAVTGDDEDNLVISLLSKREFRVRRVAARINNPKNAWLFNARMGVDIPVNDAQMIARSLEADINIGGMVQLLRLREGQATLLEFTISPTSHVVGKQIQMLNIPPECVLVAVLRGEAVIIPSSDTCLAVGDQVVAIAHIDREALLSECFH